MPKRILSVILVLLLAHVAFADDDLPDLEKVVEKHQAILESIRTGRITYVEESTPGTDDLEEFKKHYRVELREQIRKGKAVGTDKRLIALHQSQLNDIDTSAAEALMNATTSHRIKRVFDKDADTVKIDSKDLRDIPTMMTRWGLSGEPYLYQVDQSSCLSRDAYKFLHSVGGGRQAYLILNKRTSEELPVFPMHFTGLLMRNAAETYADEGLKVKSRKVYRDAGNPDLVIEEVIFSPMTWERVPVFKGGKGSIATLPLKEPVTREIITVLDESAQFRKTSRVEYENGRPWREYTYEYTSDEVLWLPSTVVIKWYRKDGSVKETQTFRVESSELNVEIAAAEFEIEVPPGAVIRDNLGPKPRVITPDELDELAEELREEPAAVEGRDEDDESTVTADGALVEEPAVVETPPRVSRAREDGGGAIMTVGIAFVVIAAIIVVAVWARRRQD